MIERSVVWVDFIALVAIIVGFLFVFNPFESIMYIAIIAYFMVIKDGIYGKK